VKLGQPDAAVPLYQQPSASGRRRPSSRTTASASPSMKQGKVAEAAGHFREALRLKPDYEFARANLERALAALGPRE